MNITYRTQLLGSIADFCAECALPLATPEVVVDLLVRLSRYREEGTELAPQVYLTDDIDLLVKMLPEGEKLPISVTSINAGGVEEMLKLCAPLARGEWRVFGQEREQLLHFGLFRGLANPLSITVDDTLLSEQDEINVIKAHQIADQCVQLRSSKNHNHYVFFNHRRQESPPPLQHIDDLVSYIVKSLHIDEKDRMKSFMKNTVTNALLGSHGCILAVTNMKRAPKFILRDALLLTAPIDFPAMIRELMRSTNTSTWLQFIEKKAELVTGMIGSDGITLFDQYGRLLAYRCFIPTPGETAVVGGARRRAFDTLTRHLGKGLSAAFMQSQDGWTDFRSAGNE